MAILPKRLQPLKHHSQEPVILPRDKVLQDVLSLQKVIHNPFDTLSLISAVDTSDMTINDVKTWLDNLALGDEQVHVYWLSENEGITISFKLFSQYYDELWYPAADDVVLTPSDNSWLLTLDHEERFQLWKRKAES